MPRCDAQRSTAGSGNSHLATLAVSVLLVASGSPAVGGSRADDLRFAKSAYVLKREAFPMGARARRGLHRSQRYDRRGNDARAGSGPRAAIAAFADNGHDTENDSHDAWWPAARLPVRMLWFHDVWVIARADRQTRTCSVPASCASRTDSPSEVFARLRKFWGGLDTIGRWNLEPAVVEQAGMLHAVALVRHADRLSFEIQRADGRRVHRALRFVPKSTLPPGQIFERVWSPAPWPGDAERGWHAFNPPTTPLYLQDGARLFRVERVPELNALFLQMRVHFDMDGVLSQTSVVTSTKRSMPTTYATS